MNLPSITPEMIQQRMTMVWNRANIAWQQSWMEQSKLFQAEYDYLSHYMTADRVYQILDRCNENV